ncbi:DMT family transporter [Aliirhizobium terrae]|uniref:DMT family transporter n=1 Tax=Terrirhizobium terrae TaxID=2926709 RepID=UPI002576D86E|nr:DMT family transporter [Rhizobium sp. CC-CFT758]WJH39941.1 DMT family transporter [Rhizobium sp. CC-CFT758]
MSSSNSPTPRPVDWLIFLLVPVFFSTNIIFGRGIIGDVAPYTTAFLRWAGSTLVMLPFIYADREAAFAFTRRHFWLWLLLGGLGMGICGGVVYWSLTYTTAANGTLIYTTSPLFIILFQWLFARRAIGALEFAGMAVAFAGVIAIVVRGDPSALLAMQFNIGDFGILIAAVAFAVYSILLKSPALKTLRPMALFGIIALSGALVLLPPTAIEVFNGGAVPDSAMDWWKIAGMVAFASLAAFFCFQHVVRVFGPATAGVTLYLMPPFSIVMAVIFLDEAFEPYHAVGIVLVLGGVILASRGGARRNTG